MSLDSFAPIVKTAASSSAVAEQIVPRVNIKMHMISTAKNLRFLWFFIKTILSLFPENKKSWLCEKQS
jgi:hypothetical protein